MIVGRMTQQRGRRITIALGALAIVILGRDVWAQGMPPSAVRVDEVVIENVQEMRRVTGDLRAVARSRVATNEGGIVLELPVIEGQIVKKGEVLATIDSRRLDLLLMGVVAQEQVAIATFDEREADVELSRNDLELLQLMTQRNASNPKELSDAQSTLKADEARRDQARHQLAVIRASADLLRTRLEDTNILAPFDGVVVQKDTEVGEWIGEGDTVVELVAIGACDAWLDIPQRYANAIIGKDILIQIDVEAIQKKFKPLKSRVIRQVDPIARTFSAVVRLDDADNVLAPGMSVIGWVPTGKYGEHLTIDKDALMTSLTGYFVYVVREGRDGALMAMQAPIRIEFDLGERLAITSGELQAGDRIVVEGNERLFPTAPVVISTLAATEVSRP